MSNKMTSHREKIELIRMFGKFPYSRIGISKFFAISIHTEAAFELVLFSKLQNLLPPGHMWSFLLLSLGVLVKLGNEPIMVYVRPNIQHGTLRTVI